MQTTPTIVGHCFNNINTNFSVGEQELIHPKSVHSYTYLKKGDVEMNLMIGIQPGNVDSSWVNITIHVNGKPTPIYAGRIEDLPNHFKGESK
jgi:hypothetical protein